MKKSQKRAVAVGAGVAALAAGAAAAYYLTGKGGAKNRKKVAAWASRAKKEVVKEVKKAGVDSQSAYNKAVDAVMKNYQNIKTLDTAAVMALAEELKGHWKAIQKDIKKLAIKKAPAKKKNTAKARK